MLLNLSTIEDQLIEISSNTPEVGKVVEEIERNFIDGEELKISFSAKYMMDALRAIEGNEIKDYFYRCDETICYLSNQ